MTSFDSRLMIDLAKTSLGQACLFSVSWAVMASAMVFESDAYRYVTIIFAAIAVFRLGPDVRRVSNDWLAILCYTWAAYVVVRFCYGILVYGEKGTSEWLYLFPLFFPLIGVVLFASRQYLYLAATFLIVLSLIALLLTLDFETLRLGERAAPLYHNNPIHAGVGSGMIFLSSLFWLLYSGEAGKLRGASKWPILAVGVTTVLLSLVGILGAHSKGVWLAVAATSGFLCILCLFQYAGRWKVPLLATLAVTSLTAVMLAYPYVEKVAGPTISSATDLIEDALASRDPLHAIQRSIESASTPPSMQERLKLLSNAIEVAQGAPWIGWGSLWLREWKQTTYSDVPHIIIHNGYLEILVRHGTLGIITVVVFSLVAFKRVKKLHKEGRLSISLAGFIYSMSFFFFCTIATNSNNRLALGESFFILMGAAVFASTLASRDGVGPSEEQLKN
nr:O-antigen ligase domain-containing protein [Rhizobium sp. Khangiran2]